jgi:hypothetical protein
MEVLRSPAGFTRLNHEINSDIGEIESCKYSWRDTRIPTILEKSQDSGCLKLQWRNPRPLSFYRSMPEWHNTTKFMLMMILSRMWGLHDSQLWVLDLMIGLINTFVYNLFYSQSIMAPSLIYPLHKSMGHAPYSSSYSVGLFYLCTLNYS